jgi:hypothetical protein
MKKWLHDFKTSFNQALESRGATGIKVVDMVLGFAIWVLIFMIGYQMGAGII